MFLKQGYEDWVRHRGDGAINRKLVTQVDTESVNQIHVFESCLDNNNTYFQLKYVLMGFLKPKLINRIQILALILVTKSSSW